MNSRDRRAKARANARAKGAPKSKAGAKKTIGLVLEGGGAKGAFQFGCLLALEEAGFSFDVIAGTSVGAINAALWSTRKMNWGKTFWKTISFDKTYPLRKPPILYVPLAVAYAFNKMIINRVMKSTTVGPFLLYAWVWIVYISFLALTIFGLMAIADLVVTRHFSFDIVEVQFFLCFGLAMIPAAAIIITEWFGISAFTSKPLKTGLTVNILGEEFRTPVFATVSEQREVYDPDNLKYFSTGIPPSAAISVPVSTEIYVPEYVRVDKDESSCERLLASAALPFGAVPMVGKYVDGGVSDNIPVYPCISLMPCDELLVVRANNGKLSKELVLEHWQNTERLQRISKYDAMSAHIANPRPVPLHRNEPDREWKPYSQAEPLRMPDKDFKVISIEPSRWVLSRFYVFNRPFDFFTRTLNFRPEFTIPEMNAGYKAAKKKIASGELDRLRR